MSMVSPVTPSARSRYLRMPAVQALLIQSGCFFLVVLAAHALPVLVDLQLTVLAAGLLQGVMSALLGRRLRMAAWWVPIQFCFPLIALLVHAARLPPWIFLVSFLAMLVLYWSTYRTQVPFYPSGRAIWDAVAGALPAGRPFSFIDVGSGFGGMVLHLARLRPDCVCTGIELAPLPWMASSLVARWRSSPAHFSRGDYADLDFADYDVVFAYLSPAAMPALWRKASSEMRSGSLLLSVEFPVPGQAPDLVLQPAGGKALYGWYIPKLKFSVA